MCFLFSECQIDNDCSATRPLCDKVTGSCMEGKRDIKRLHFTNLFKM